MRSPAPSRSFGGKKILLALIVLGLIAYTGIVALKMMRQAPMNTPMQNESPDPSRATAVLDHQTNLLNLPQGAAPAVPDVPVPPQDAATSGDSGSQDNSNAGVDAPAPDQPQNTIRAVPDVGAGDTAGGAASADSSMAPPAAPQPGAAPEQAPAQGAPVVPLNPTPQAAPAPVVPLAPGDSGGGQHDQLRQFLHDSLQRTLRNPSDGTR